MNLVEKYVLWLKDSWLYIKREIRTITYNQSREIEPVYTMGNSQPIMNVRGRAYISGTIEFGRGITYRQYQSLIAMNSLDTEGIFQNKDVPAVIFDNFDLITGHHPEETYYNFLASSISIKTS